MIDVDSISLESEYLLTPLPAQDLFIIQESARKPIHSFNTYKYLGAQIKLTIPVLLTKNFLETTNSYNYT